MERSGFRSLDSTFKLRSKSAPETGSILIGLASAKFKKEKIQKKKRENTEILISFFNKALNLDMAVNLIGYLFKNPGFFWEKPVFKNLRIKARNVNMKFPWNH